MDQLTYDYPPMMRIANVDLDAVMTGDSRTEPDGQDKTLAEATIKKRNWSISKPRFKMHFSSAGQPFITLLWFTFLEHPGLLLLGNVGKSTAFLGYQQPSNMIDYWRK